jgi:hypothetical protein
MAAADGQREDLAGQVNDVAESIHQAGEHLKGNQGWVAHIIEAGAAELGSLASALRKNDFDGLMGKLQDLAWRQPAIFVGVAMAAGFAGSGRQDRRRWRFKSGSALDAGGAP